MSNTPSEDLYWGLHGLSKILEGSGFIDESKHPDAYATILDAMAFVRSKPQPVVRKPLTDEQIKDEASYHGFIGSTEMLVKFVRAIEQAHGITGGQHDGS